LHYSHIIPAFSGFYTPERGQAPKNMQNTPKNARLGPKSKTIGLRGRTEEQIPVINDPRFLWIFSMMCYNNHQNEFVFFKAGNGPRRHPGQPTGRPSRWRIAAKSDLFPAGKGTKGVRLPSNTKAGLLERRLRGSRSLYGICAFHRRYSNIWLTTKKADANREKSLQ
jgi:hypothetical protein